MSLNWDNFGFMVVKFWEWRLQDIEIPEMGFPKLEYIQLRAGRVPVGHEFLPLTVYTSAWVNHFCNIDIL